MNVAKHRGRPRQSYSLEQILHGAGRDAEIARAWNDAFRAERAAGAAERAARGRATQAVAKAHRLSPRHVQAVRRRFNAARAQLDQIGRTPGIAALAELHSNIRTLQLDRFYDGDVRVCLRITRRLLKGVNALDKVERLEAENKQLEQRLAAERVWQSPASARSTKRK